MSTGWAPTSSDLRTSRRWRVPLSDVRLPREAVDAASEVLRSGWLSSGPRVERFEADLARYVGTPHAVACSSGTAALQLAVTALGIGAGDEVVMPSLTFVAAANAVRLVGARPVFADVKGEDDLTLDPDAAKAAIGPRTRAILPVHYGGWPCDPALRELADSHRLALVEDAAHALGAEAWPGRCGSWGDAGCFSFFANKNLPLGEGGMLATNDPAVAETARRLRSHGMTSGTWERQAAAPMAYDVTMPGFNARLDEVRAAMGSALLPLLDEMNAARARAAERYRARLAGIPDLGVPFSGRGPQETSAHHLFVVLLSPGRPATRWSPASLAVGCRPACTTVRFINCPPMRASPPGLIAQKRLPSGCLPFRSSPRSRLSR